MFDLQESDYPVYYVIKKGQVPKNGDVGALYKVRFYT